MESIKHFEGQCESLAPAELAEPALHLWRLSVPPVEDVAAAIHVDDVFALGRVHDAERESALAGRGALRVLLARYLRVHPLAILVSRDAHGSFALGAGRSVRFAQSKNDDLLLVALAEAAPPQLALERARTDLPFEDLARAYLEPEQIWEVLTSRDADRTTRFLRHWTRNEVMSHFQPDEVVSVWAVEPEPDCTATLAVAGDDWHLRCFQWDPLAPTRAVAA